MTLYFKITPRFIYLLTLLRVQNVHISIYLFKKKVTQYILLKNQYYMHYVNEFQVVTCFFSFQFCLQNCLGESERNPNKTFLGIQKKCIKHLNIYFLNVRKVSSYSFRSFSKEVLSAVVIYFNTTFFVFVTNGS